MRGWLRWRFSSAWSPQPGAIPDAYDPKPDPFATPNPTPSPTMKSRTDIDVPLALQSATIDLSQLGFNASVDKGP